MGYGLIFKTISLIMLLQLSHFPPLFLSILHTLSHLNSSPFSSCPWVIYISSSASIFPILFLISPCLFSTYHLCFLFPVPSIPLPTHSSADNPPCDLHFWDSVPVLVVCLVCFCFGFRCGC